jgi:hypothetical protein
LCLYSLPIACFSSGFTVLPSLAVAYEEMP